MSLRQPATFPGSSRFGLKQKSPAMKKKNTSKKEHFCRLITHFENAVNCSYLEAVSNWFITNLHFVACNTLSINTLDARGFSHAHDHARKGLFYDT